MYSFFRLVVIKYRYQLSGGDFLKTLKKIVYVILQCTWGLPQTLLGLLVFLLNLKHPHKIFGKSILTLWPSFCGVSLGLFIFSSAEDGDISRSLSRGGRKDDANTATVCDRMTVHEYGHTFQSLILGPLYLFVIGIPSMVWGSLPYFRKLRDKKGLGYDACYTERWADELGEKATGRRSIRDFHF